MTSSLSMQETIDLAIQEDGEHASRRCAGRAGRHRFGGVSLTYGSQGVDRNKNSVCKDEHTDPGQWREVLVDHTLFALGNGL